MKGRFNVAYSDVNELAAPVLRHRMKMNFEAIAERVTPDDVVKMIIEEVSKKFGVSTKKSNDAPANNATEVKVTVKVENVSADNVEVNVDNEENTEPAKGKKKFGLFGKK